MSLNASLRTIAKAVLRPVLPKGFTSGRFKDRSLAQLDAFMQEELREFWQPVETGALPPYELVKKTGALSEEDFENQTRDAEIFANSYLGAGAFTARIMIEQLAAHGFNLRTIGTILELGCGEARILRHFRGMDGVRLIGADTRAESIDWCRANIPGPDYYVNELTPPLAFAADGSVDLAYAFSVFTHIPPGMQKPWLDEIHRILRPGGVFLCTVVGKSHCDHQLSSGDMIELKRTGEFVLTSQDAAASLSTRVGGSGWDIFQTRQKVIEVFGDMFDIDDYVPNGGGLSQDLLVLRKPEKPAAQAPAARQHAKLVHDNSA